MDDVILAIKALLEANLPTGVYKNIYYGPNLVPAESEIPCVEIIPMEEGMTNKGTNSMMNEFRIKIRITDSLKAFNTSNTKKTILGQVQAFVKRMGERDSNHKPLSSTILGVMHDNRQLTNTVHINRIGVVKDNFDELHEGRWIVRSELNIQADLISLRS